jgi:hypothetical protein
MASKIKGNRMDKMPIIARGSFKGLSPFLSPGVFQYSSGSSSRLRTFLGPSESDSPPAGYVKDGLGGVGLVKGETRGEGEAECVWCRGGGSCVHFFCFAGQRGDLPPNAWSL